VRLLLAVIVIAALGWSAYWVIGQRGLVRGLEDWFEARRAEGWVAETSELRVRGFPNRFDTGLSDLVLADPETGLAWEVPYFQLNALSYRPNHVIAVWPEEQRIATPREKFRLKARDMRASLRIAPGSAFAPDNLTLTAEFLQITPEARANETTALTALTLAGQRLEDRTYRLGAVGRRADAVATVARPAGSGKPPAGADFGAGGRSDGHLRQDLGPQRDRGRPPATHPHQGRSGRRALGAIALAGGGRGRGDARGPARRRDHA